MTNFVPSWKHTISPSLTCMTAFWVHIAVKEWPVPARAAYKNGELLCVWGSWEGPWKCGSLGGGAVLQRSRAPPPSVFVLWMDNTLQRFVLEQMCPQDIKNTTWCAGPKWLTIGGETVHFTFDTACLSTRTLNYKFKNKTSSFAFVQH